MPLRRAERARRFYFIVLLAALASSAGLLAQAPPTPDAARTGGPLALAVEPSGESAPFTFFNRQIVVFRARTLGRTPAERAETAARTLEGLVERGITGPIEQRIVEGAVLISLGSHGVFALTRLDVDEVSGERLDEAASASIARLRQAIDEAVEAHAPGALLRAVAASLAITAVALLLLWAIFRLHRVVSDKLVAIAERTVAKSGIADLQSLRASRLLDFQRGLLTSAATALDLVIVYATVGFVLRRFPYTRPWGESMRGFLVTTGESLGLSVLQAMPGLFTAAVIFVIARFAVRLIGLWFSAVEQGRIRARYIYPETALPTRRLLTALLWLFALAVAYPYLPGSQSEAFKGLSVFLGLLVTFGSSGVVSQLMSGLMITYSRALRLGDYVKIGDVEGTVVHLGVLSIKMRSPFGEELTVPNAVVVAQTTTDYSRPAASGVFTSTTVTIGYDAPWRQVQALLLQAAGRTAGIRQEPAPYVLQMGLEDFYVKYTLFFALERQEARYIVKNTLHAHIQDLFNEHGVQIMSPNYFMDPAAPKLVAKQDWYAAPAAPDSQVRR